MERCKKCLLLCNIIYSLESMVSIYFKNVPLQGGGVQVTYFQHLKANWKVAAHSLSDALEHFLHGLIPFIKWEHKQKMKEGM